MLRQALLSGSPSPALKASGLLQFESALASSAPQQELLEPALQQAPELWAQSAPESKKRLPVPAKRALKAQELKPSASESSPLELPRLAARQPVPVDD